MFNSARIKLTLWYLLIISIITTLFSVAVYRGFTMEFDRVVRLQRLRQERTFDPFSPSSPTVVLRIDTQLVEESKERIKLIIFFIDLGIVSASTIAAYFLAGRTLLPIEEMVEEQKRFTADASHELRTPLTALKSEIEVALRDKNLNLKEARELLKSNLEETNKLKSLSDYLLDLSKYEDSSIELNFDQLDLGLIVDEALKKVSPLAKNKAIKIESKIESLKIQANRQTLLECLVILLDNAVKFSKPSGKVELKAFRFDHQVEILVKDYGVGIDKKDLPFIFNRFYQADSSREKVGGGVGLGLSIAQRITKLHHGTISVASEKGHGATFTIKLPLEVPRGFSAKFQV